MWALAATLMVGRRGTTAIEYALVAGLIGLAIVGVMASVGGTLSGVNGPLVAAANAL